MRATWTVATIGGTAVRVHATFSLLVAWFVAFAVSIGHTPASLAPAVLLLLLTCACVIAHEFGHVTAAKAFGIATPEIMLLPIGAISRLEKNPDDPLAEILIAGAGPAVSLSLAAIALIVAIIQGDQDRLALADVALAGFGAKLFWSNVLIAGINLLPALPLDGGKLLRALLLQITHARIASGAVAVLSYGTVALLAWAGRRVDPIFFVMAALILHCAWRELGRLRATEAAKPPSVRAAMTTDCVTLAPDTRLVDLIETVFTTQQRHFPVLKDGTVAGIVARADVARGLGGGRSAATVADIMQVEVPLALADEPLADAQARLAILAVTLMPVVDRSGTMIGALFSDEAGERVQEHEAQKEALAAG